MIRRCIARCLAFIDVALSWVGDPTLKNHPPDYIDYLFIRHDCGFKKIASNTIQYIKAASSYCEVHLTDGSTMLVSVPLSEVVKHLPSNNFIRIHRSFSVNFLHIDSFIGNTLVMDSGVKLPIGRDHRKAVLGRFTLIGTKSRKYTF